MHLGKLYILALCLLFSACKKSSESLAVHSCHGEYLCTADGSIIKWNTSAITFSYEDTAPEKLRLAISASTAEYNDYFTNTSLVIDDKDNRAPPYKEDYNALNRDNVNGIYYVEGTWPWASRIPGSLAVTLTRYSANGIVEADIFIKGDKATYLESAKEEKLPWITYITQHELGHALGRSHSKEKTSLMYPSVSPIKIQNLVSQENFDNFFSLYDLEVFDLAYN